MLVVFKIPVTHVVFLLQVLRCSLASPAPNENKQGRAGVKVFLENKILIEFQCFISGTGLLKQVQKCSLQIGPMIA